MDQLSMAKLMMQVNELPALPHITTRVIELTDNPRSTNQEICNAICQDQVIASKVLKLVNSAYYGLPRKVASVTDAITILGTQTVRTLVIGASVYKTLNHLKSGGGISPKKIWRHAAVCAESCKELAVMYGVGEREHAFIAGLLHDIGKTILAYFWSKDNSTVREMADIRGCSLIEAEQFLLDSTHADIGRMVAEKWSLPGLLVDTIGYHHDPLHECTYSQQVQMVHLADIIAVMAGYGTSFSKELNFDRTVLDNWNLTPVQLQKLSVEVIGNLSFDYL